MSEFSLINHYFASIGKSRSDVLLGVGDDAAIVDVAALNQLAISTDTLIENVHFPQSTSAYDVGWKSLAVNLSDMAAMGAEPLWVTLAISLPGNNESWLKEFVKGFSVLAEKYSVQLIGGDTTRGPLSVTVQIIGNLSNTSSLTRDAAKPGDRIFVTGKLGDAALGLKSYSQKLPLSSTELNELRLKLNRPEPRLNEIDKLGPFINAAIDVSDGLHADLRHILEASDVGAEIQVSDIPVSRSYCWCCTGEQSYDLALTGGDDYELCFTVPEDKIADMQEIVKSTNIAVTQIGEIVGKSGLKLLKKNQQEYFLSASSYDHFTNNK